MAGSGGVRARVVVNAIKPVASGRSANEPKGLSQATRAMWRFALFCFNVHPFTLLLKIASQNLAIILLPR